jgi:hypothetical protein
MNIDQAQHRYNNDANFHQLVEMFYQFMYEMRFTHEDLRNAAFLAAVQIEHNREPAQLEPWYPEKKSQRSHINGKY